jgi:ribose transport system ATP-binding protein
MSTESRNTLQMHGICKSFDGGLVLRDVDFSAEAGEVHAISGENGAGKSTLMRILSGAISRDSGEILLDGHPINVANPFQAHRLGIRAVYQEFSLIPHLTVAENILLGQMPVTKSVKWIDWPKANQAAENILQEIGFSGLDVRSRVSHLGVSQQQMVEIAKAVATKPRILILDEPSAVLSQEELKRLFTLIRKLKQDSALVLYISHRLDEVFEIADRITVLKDGQVVGTVRPKETDQSTLIKMMVGRALSEIYPKREAKARPTVLAVEKLSREGSFHNISFTLGRGEIVGFFGLVGSGRTQLVRAIFGAEPATSGEVRLENRVLRLKSPSDALRSGIALLTEDRKRDGLVLSCSMGDNISLASLDRISRWGILNMRRRNEGVQQKIQDLNIRPPESKRLIRYLSGGNQQKVVLAKWLLTQAKVLLLDEPTRGVDVATKVELYQIMNDLANSGVAILLVSSELPEVLGMSDRVWVMRERNLVGEFTKAQASEENLLAAAAGVNV